MNLETAPVRNWGGKIIELILDPIRLLRCFPDHIQAPEWKREIEAVRKTTPEAYFHAKLIVSQEFANEDVLREHPEHCLRCAGELVYVWRGRTVRCSCPTAEAKDRNRSMEEDAFDRGIVEALPEVTPEDQMLLKWGNA